MLTTCSKVILMCNGKVDYSNVLDEVNGTLISEVNKEYEVMGNSNPVKCRVIDYSGNIEDADECIVNDSTSIVVKNIEGFNVLYRDNESTLIEYGNEVYVYPSELVDEIMLHYIEPLKRGEDPINRGLLLAGPPGTGKTTLLNALADATGFNTVTVSATDVLNMYVGESERNLQRLFDNAIKLQPSVMLIDDFEWLGLARVLSRSEESWRFSMFNVLADFFTRINKEKHKVLVAAATNVSKEILDPALRREGRFGEPLIIPPPTANQWRVWFNHAKGKYPWLRRLINSVGEDKVKGLLTSAAAAGHSPSEIITALRKWLNKGGGEVPSLGSPTTGFRRIYMSEYVKDDAAECIAEKISRIIEKNGKAMLSTTREVTRDDSALLEAILANSIMLLGKAAVMPTDSTRFMDTLTAAQLMHAAVAIPTPEILANYPVETQEAYVPVLIITKAPPQAAFTHKIPTIPLLPCERNGKTIDIRQALPTLLRITALYYGIQYTQVKTSVSIEDAAALASLIKNMSFTNIETALVYIQSRFI